MALATKDPSSSAISWYSYQIALHYIASRKLLIPALFMRWILVAQGLEVKRAGVVQWLLKTWVRDGIDMVQISEFLIQILIIRAALLVCAFFVGVHVQL